MGYGYFLLDAIDPVEEVGDLAGDSVLRRRGSDIINILPRSFLAGAGLSWPKTQMDK